MPSLSIVIPTLDEEAVIATALANACEHADEVLLSDGDSADRTCAIAHGLGVEPIVGAPGRGAQIRRATARASGDVILGLHADTLLPPTAGRRVREAVAAGALGGGFLVLFTGGPATYRLGERFVNWRTRVGRMPLGDQAQFATREALETLGGYPDWPILEDVDLIRRLRRLGPLAVIPDPVSTSARRFTARGGLRTVALNWLIFTLYFAGVSPSRLARLYPKIR